MTEKRHLESIGFAEKPERDPQADINAFWTALERSWNIEPRSYFEAEAPKNGFGSPLAMAVHYMWKREVKALTCEDREVVDDG